MAIIFSKLLYYTSDIIGNSGTTFLNSRDLLKTESRLCVFIYTTRVLILAYRLYTMQYNIIYYIKLSHVHCTGIVQLFVKTVWKQWDSRKTRTTIRAVCSVRKLTRAHSNIRNDFRTPQRLCVCECIIILHTHIIILYCTYRQVKTIRFLRKPFRVVKHYVYYAFYVRVRVSC